MRYLVYTSFGPKNKLNGEFENFEDAAGLVYEMINAFPMIADNLKKKYNFKDEDLVWSVVSDTEWSTGRGTIKVFIVESSAAPAN